MVEPSRPVRGVARVAFLANQALIETELREGWTAKSIYQRHADKLADKISYPQFARYVRTNIKQSPPVPPPKQPQPEDAKSANAGRHSNLSRTFSFEAEAKPGERAQLIGPPRNKPK